MAVSVVLDERSGSMKRSRFTEEQIVYALRKLSLALRSAISADNTGANLLCVEEEICPSGRERTPAVAARRKHYGVVSWTGSRPGRPAGTVEYGFRA